ncbi:MAG: hypothetical protein ACOC89_03215 [Candidatus Saliniplasma sp.]
MALEEREKWRKRENEITEKLEEIKKKKKRLTDKAKRLKENIAHIEDALRAVKRGEVDKTRIIDRFDEHILR